MLCKIFGALLRSELRRPARREASGWALAAPAVTNGVCPRRIPSGHSILSSFDEDYDPRPERVQRAGRPGQHKEPHEVADDLHVGRSAAGWIALDVDVQYGSRARVYLFTG